MLSNILFAIGLLYLIAAFVELPIFYMGNPKTRFLIQKMGKRNYKIMLIVLGTALVVGGFLLR